MFYFAVRYGSMDNISENFFADQKEELYQWSLSDPVDDFERNRNNEIYNLQQNRNPFVDCPELLDRIDIGNTTFPQYNERK